MSFSKENMNNPEKSVFDIVDEWDPSSEDETEVGGSQITNSTVDDAALSLPCHSRSKEDDDDDDDDDDKRSGTATGNSEGESEDDVVEGTPDKSHASDPKNHSVINNHIYITYSNFETENELLMLENLSDVFQLNVQMEWSDRVTHLVVKTLADGTCTRTTKIMNAILFNCFIVSMEWAKNSLISNKLLPELDYIPLDISKEYSPLVSWRVGRGIIDSPLEWTKNCILYFHSSVQYNDSYSDLILWAQRGGFVIANDLGEFKSNNYNMRIILVDLIEPCNDVQSQVPEGNEIMNWLCDYKAITLFVDWFLECLFRYRFYVISPEYQVMKLTSKMVEYYTNMDECLFTFETFE